MPIRDKRRTLLLSDEDNKAWQDATSGVTPLKSDKPQSQQARDSDSIQNSSNSAAPATTVAETLRVMRAKFDSLANGASAGEMAELGIPDARASSPDGERPHKRKLRPGEPMVEARLDLHGKSHDQARAATWAFILEQSERGARCVLVITGRGVEDQGVLKTHFSAWIKHRSIVSLVLEVRQAAPRDGGAGAWYVLLKKQRPNRRLR